MSALPADMYLSLMKTIRARLDFADSLSTGPGDPFSRAETAAFHGRKVVEGIAFGCLVATHHGLKHIPRDAKGKWNAAEILQSLQKKNLEVFPSPSAIRFSTPEEQASAKSKGTIEGIPERRLSHDELVRIYARLHRWLHELNPYVANDREAFRCVNDQYLWADLKSVNKFIEQHFIAIRGQAFFCVLRDKIDGQTKVASFSQLALDGDA